MDVDTRTFDQNSLSRGEDLVLNKHALVVGVLENDALIAVPKGYLAAQDDQLTHHQSPAGLRNEDVPKTCEQSDYRWYASPIGCQTTVKNGFKSEMVNKVGFCPSVQAKQSRNSGKLFPRG
jgi:hypothetical protein